MILLLTAALAQSCEPHAAVASLRLYDARAKDAYVCLAEHAEGARVVLDALAAMGPVAPTVPTVVTDEAPAVVPVADDARMVEARFARALALWLIHHDEAPWDDTIVARLGPADRRLAADGVHARRGRKSPVPEHERVFSQFAWYQPRAQWTANLLTEVDRANIDAVNRPPPPPPAPEVVPEEPGTVAALPAAPVEPAGGCGCATGTGRGGLLAVVVALLGVGRRRGGAVR